MVDLKEVLEFIKNSDQSELKQIRNQVRIRKSELDYSTKTSFSVGDVVNIDHKKIDSNQKFRITKINSKNIKVQSIVGDGRVGGIYTVSPSLLVASPTNQ
jgi:intergrase/recombinase